MSADRSLQCYSDHWRNTEKKRLLSISNHTCFPVAAGGHQRIFNLNHELLKSDFSVLQLSQAVRKSEMLKLRSIGFDIAEDFFELHHFRPFFQAANVALERKHLPPLNFLRFSGAAWQHPLIKRHAAIADAIVVEHPWLFPKQLATCCHGTPVIQNSHNIEYDLFDQLLDTPALRKYLPEIFAGEQFAFHSATASLVCSEQDRQRAIELYGVDEHKVHVIPNGVTVPPLRLPDRARQRELRETYGIRERPTLLFVGSAHPPNVTGLGKLLDLLGEIADDELQLLVLGDVAASLPQHAGDWVIPVGRVDALEDWFHMADIAVNPIMEGAGTNVKMLDYMAQSMAIISTPVGARGLDLRASVDAEIVAIEHFPETIRALLADPQRRARIAEQAWNSAQQRFSWQPIAASMAAILDQLIATKQATGEW